MRLLSIAVVVALASPSLAGEFHPVVGTEIGYQLVPALELTEVRGTDLAMPHHLTWGMTWYDEDLILDADATAMGGALLSALLGGVIPSPAIPTPTSGGTNMTIQKFAHMRAILPFTEGKLKWGTVVDLGFGARGLTDNLEVFAEPDVAGGFYLSAGAGPAMFWQMNELLVLSASASIGAHASNSFQFGGVQLALEGEAIITLAPNLFWLKLEVMEENWFMGKAWTESNLSTQQHDLQFRVSLINNLLGLLCSEL